MALISSWHFKNVVSNTVDSGDIASRQVSWGTVLISTVLVSAIITGVVVIIVERRDSSE